MSVLSGAAILALGLTLVFAVGCRTRVTAAGMMMESYPSNRVSMNSAVFGDWFKVVNSALAKGDNGLLKATVSMENLQDRDCAIEYRYRWIDSDGIEVTSGTSIWIHKGVQARGTVMLSGIAPAKRAVDFILDIRFVHDSTRWRH